MRLGRLCAAGLPAVMLAGCGLNAVRVASASDVGAAASAVTTITDGALKDAADRRRRAYVTLIASDPSCSPVTPVYIFVPRGPGMKGAPLCARSARDTRAGYDVVPIDFSPLATEAIKPTLDLAAAIAAYGAAMTKIADAPDTDVSADLGKAIEFAGKARAVAEALGASDLPDVAKIGEQQLSTASALVNFFVRLAQEQRKVRDIAALYARDHAEVDRATDELYDQLMLWQQVVARQAQQVTGNNLRRAYDASARTISFEARQSLITLIADSDADEGRIDQAAKKTHQALWDLKESEQDLATALQDPSPDQRRKAAAITRQRIWSALNLIADAFLAWKGI